MLSRPTKLNTVRYLDR